MLLGIRGLPIVNLADVRMRALKRNTIVSSAFGPCFGTLTARRSHRHNSVWTRLAPVSMAAAWLRVLPDAGRFDRDFLLPTHPYLVPANFVVPAHASGMRARSRLPGLSARILVIRPGLILLSFSRVQWRL